MPRATKGSHHQHLRKRAGETLPHPQAGLKRTLDKMSYIMGVAGPIMTLPQIYKVYTQHNAGGLSMVTFISYCIISSFWFTYALAHQEKPLILTYFCWVIIDLVLLIGIILYG